eukprot:CAMPEP_0181215094 /NCGR_PEP_ID=MMETSP1096-20121128/25825_1 /TAXON_ID=156174 ORGANISM="Chrysochromulina ericina, Strain CCMP281" /NCGR_SAMPLE_ID=MMETSP1096 /ASSEMBLY_ACC=CAM_ASM_000453 /LENGTH=142 /DNA_ID=CAMNT_0023306917 /DNA_START=298 /DNA_END=724 /DNA_ORIENTATION=-
MCRSQRRPHGSVSGPQVHMEDGALVAPRRRFAVQVGQERWHRLPGRKDTLHDVLVGVGVPLEVAVHSRSAQDLEDLRVWREEDKMGVEARIATSGRFRLSDEVTLAPCLLLHPRERICSQQHVSVAQKQLGKLCQVPRKELD